MNEIGLRLFQQLKKFDPDANRDDYFHEEDRSWDVNRIESNLRLAQERNVANSTTNAANSSPALANTVHHVAPSEAQSKTTPTSTPMEMSRNANGTDTHKQSSHALPIIIEQSLSNHQQSGSYTIQKTTQVGERNIVKMPSPNGSPSIDLDERNNDNNMASQASLLRSDQHRISSVPVTRSKSKSPSSFSSPRQTRANSNFPSKKAVDKKRNLVSMKADSNSNPNNSVTANQPPHKKQRRTYVPFLSAHAQWNEVSLKKLTMLKRSVKNSDWFWERVDEQKHMAPKYYLVCPMASDFGTICDKLEKNEYDDLDAFLREAELVFINARMYNAPDHPVHLASMTFEKKFKEAMTGIVKQYYEQFGSAQTWECWENAKRSYKPFAVPED